MAHILIYEVRYFELNGLFITQLHYIRLLKMYMPITFRLIRNWRLEQDILRAEKFYTRSLKKLYLKFKTFCELSDLYCNNWFEGYYIIPC